jgi:hypothetical protein
MLRIKRDMATRVPERLGRPSLDGCPVPARWTKRKPGQKAGPDALPGLIAIPVAYVLLDLVLSQAVPLLNLAFALFTVSIDYRQVVVGEFAPLLFDFAFDLFPVSFNTVPIHVCLVINFWG